MRSELNENGELTFLTVLTVPVTGDRFFTKLKYNLIGSIKSQTDSCTVMAYPNFRFEKSFFSPKHLEGP